MGLCSTLLCSVGGYEQVISGAMAVILEEEEGLLSGLPDPRARDLWHQVTNTNLSSAYSTLHQLSNPVVQTLQVVMVYSLLSEFQAIVASTIGAAAVFALLSGPPTQALGRKVR